MFLVCFWDLKFASSASQYAGERQIQHTSSSGAAGKSAETDLRALTSGPSSTP